MSEKAMPKVTVLMPAYNVEAYINEAVDSVLAQTFADFELLIINDGSTDNTLPLLQAYTDPRIRIVSQANNGLVRTLNTGLQLAAANLVARFDADDVCYPERLAIQYEFMQKHPDYVLVAGNADYMDEEGNHIFTYLCRYYEDEEIRQSAFVQCPFIHSTVMYRKEAVLKAGGYDERAITFEDHILWSKIAAEGKVKNLHERLIKVRFNPSSVTIDEKWRGKEFIDLKQRSIRTGKVSDEDLVLLKDILKRQNFGSYKAAAYHGMLGKKFLWNQHDPTKARRHLRTAIAAHPNKPEPYLLYLFSYFPASFISYVYKLMKR